MPFSRLTFAATPSSASSAAVTLRRQFSQRIPLIFTVRLPMGAESFLTRMRGCFSVPQQVFLLVNRRSSDHMHPPTIRTVKAIQTACILSHPFPVNYGSSTAFQPAAPMAFFAVPAAIGGHDGFLYIAQLCVPFQLRLHHFRRRTEFGGKLRRGMNARRVQKFQKGQGYRLLRRTTLQYDRSGRR